MSYLPPGLADLGNSFPSEEDDDVLRVRMNTRGDSSDITLLHRYVSKHESHSDTALYDGGLSLNGFVRHNHQLSSGSHHQIPIRRSSARPMPPLNPQTFHGSLGSNSTSVMTEPTVVNSSSSSSSRFGVESPYLFRRMSDLSRRLGSSSTDLSGTNLNSGYPSGLQGPSSSSTSGAPPDLEESEVEPVRQSSSSESQALYGNEQVVTDLKPDYVRWFYKYEKDLKWTPFAGYDSLRMEQRYRNILVEREELQQRYYGGANEFSASATNGYSTDSYYNNGSYYPGSESSSESQMNQQHHYGQYQDWAASNTAGMYNQSTGNLYNERNAVSSYNDPNYGFTHGVDGQQSATSASDETICGNFIVVRGGLYEADLESWTCTATYWPGDKCQITRGTWFYDETWQPLSVEHAEKLEEDHMGQFIGHILDPYPNNQPQPDSPTRKSRPVLHRVSFNEFHVDWTSPTEIHLFSKAASHKFMRSVGLKLGFQAWGFRLCRGYFRPASLSDKPPEISHIVFVIHGIGQKMDTGRIVRNCASFRELVSNLKEKFYPHLNEAKQRAEFFPVEWRSAAKLDDDIVEAITPHKLMSLRQILNATAMDIMYYTSPLYRSEITNALRNELNRIYSNFVKRNPDFVTRGGKVSVIAHSLGAVITYDIVTGYTPDFSGGPDQNVPYGAFGNMYPGGNGYYPNTTAQNGSNIPPGLLFKLEHFFCFGSPLAVFLALRWKDPHNPEVRQHILPEKLCRRIYNIFCLTDPVAYRLEPLLNKAYMIISPLSIYQYGTVGKPKYDEMPREQIRDPPPSVKAAENAAFNAMNENSSAKSTPQRMLNLKSPPTPTKESNNWGWFGIMKYLKSSENPGGPGTISDSDLVGGELISPDGNSSPSRDDEGSSTPAEYSSSDIPNDLDYRIDYVLKENAFTNSYIAALTSHTNYWTSHDTAYFVLTHLYEGLLESPSQSQAQ